MAIIDLTDDPRIDLGIARDIGRGVGGLIRQRRQKEKLEEEKEKKRIQQAETIRILNSGSTGQALINEFNQMPGAVDNAFVQTLNRKAAERRALGAKQPVNEKVAEFKRLQDSHRKVIHEDAYGALTTVPGMEIVREGIEKRLKQLAIEIFELQKPDRPAASPTQPASLPPEVTPRADEPEVTQEFGSEFFGVQEAHRPSQTQTATNPATGEKIESTDGGRTWQPVGGGDTQTTITATNPQTGEKVISKDGGKTWQKL